VGGLATEAGLSETLRRRQVAWGLRMRKAARTKALYAGSFDPITRGHLDIIGKALKTFDAVHVAIGTNVRKVRTFSVEESQRLIVASVVEQWPQAQAASGGALFDGALGVGEYTNQSLIAYARQIGASHIVRGLREASDFGEEFRLHGVAERIDPSIPMVHFICEAQFLHVSSSMAKELDAMGEGIGWLVMPSVEKAFAARRG
jgi:pantetheine-phosphate adenylyltransferase